MNPQDRGMTLLETLAAVVLLAMAVAVLTPLIDVPVAPAPRTDAVFELAGFADRFMAARSSGTPNPDAIGEAPVTIGTLAGESGRPHPVVAVRVRPSLTDDPWATLILFTWDGISIARPHDLPRPFEHGR